MYHNVFFFCSEIDENDSDMDVDNGEDDLLGVSNRWNGPLDWITGLDYWTGERMRSTTKCHAM